jgi:hypothetical protein
MVGTLASASRCVTACAYLPAFVAAAPPGEALLERLSPQQRALVTLTFVGLALVGLFLIAMIFLGARHVRRLARKPAPRATHRPLPSRNPPGVVAPKPRAEHQE